MPEADPDILRRAAARCLLEDLQEAGLTAVPPTEAPAPIAAAPPTATQDSAVPTPAPAPASTLEALDARIRACTACGLAKGRNCAVPGEGALDALLMCVGEGPGAAEDRSGRPFVGEAGQLLEKILLHGMGLRREQVFIANVVKCRPPGNRNPESEEIAACAPYLEEQIRAVQPKIVLALGLVAAHRLLGGESALGSLRGRLHPLPGHPGIQLLATYHPAYLLRNPAAKRETWQDIQIAMAELGLTRPGA